MNRIKSGAALALLGFALVVAGCGPSEVRYPETGASLEGTVKYGKEQVGAALVIAQNASGSATAPIDDDGKYRMKNVPLGEVSLAVNTAAGKGMAMGKMMAQSQGKAKGPVKLVDVPSKFADPTTSGIKTTIKKGPNTFDIEIPR